MIVAPNMTAMDNDLASCLPENLEINEENCIKVAKNLLKNTQLDVIYGELKEHQISSSSIQVRLIKQKW